MRPDEIRAWLATEGFDAASVRYGVDTYRLVYDTVYGGSRHLGANLAGTAMIVRWFGTLS